MEIPDCLRVALASAADRVWAASDHTVVVSALFPNRFIRVVSDTEAERMRWTTDLLLSGCFEIDRLLVASRDELLSCFVFHLSPHPDGLWLLRASP